MPWFSGLPVYLIPALWFAGSFQKGSAYKRSVGILESIRFSSGKSALESLTGPYDSSSSQRKRSTAGSALSNIVKVTRTSAGGSNEGKPNVVLIDMTAKNNLAEAMDNRRRSIIKKVSEGYADEPLLGEARVLKVDEHKVSVIPPLLPVIREEADDDEV